MSRFGNFDAINLILTAHPIRTVILFRLPYLGAGIVNYLLSLSVVKLKPMVIGNAIGFIPGVALFAVVGGQVRSLADAFLHGGDKKAAIITLVIVTVFVAISIVAILYTVRKVTKRQLEETGVENPSIPLEADIKNASVYAQEPENQKADFQNDSHHESGDHKKPESDPLIIRHRHWHVHRDGTAHEHEHEHPYNAPEIHEHHSHEYAQ